MEEAEHRILGLEDKIDTKEKNKKVIRQKLLRAEKGIFKNSATPSKDQACRSRTSKKWKRCKPKV
jgi:hypothetical protein